MNKTTEPAVPEPLGDSEGAATQVAVGPEPFGYIDGRGRFFYAHDPYYKDTNAGMPRVYSAATVERLVQERLVQERDKYKDSVEHYGDLYAKLAAITQERDELREWNKAMVVKAASGGVLDGYREMGKQLAASQAENEALRKDAERWRFFRIADWADWNAVFRVDHDGLSLPELLDKATDAAMKGD